MSRFYRLGRSDVTLIAGNVFDYVDSVLSHRIIGDLSYPHFSLDGLRTLPVPNPDKCSIPSLAAVYDQFASETLLPFPQMHEDPVRLALDEAVIHAVQDVPPKKVEEWRKAIPLEPSVNNKKEPFQSN